MAQNIDSKVRAKVWLTLDQVDALRSACYSTGADYLQQRNEAIIALMYDTGLRVERVGGHRRRYAQGGRTRLSTYRQRSRRTTPTTTSPHRRRWSSPQM
jgi:hypothetical protein